MVNSWIDTDKDEKLAAVIYEYIPKFYSNEDITLYIGQRIYPIKKNGDWYYATTLQNKNLYYFIIPKCYVKLINSSLSPSNSCDKIYFEYRYISQLIYIALHGWINNLKNLNHVVKLNKFIQIFKKLIESRNIDKNNNVSDNDKIIKLINEGNKYIGLDYIPYMNGKYISIENTSIYDIFNFHTDYGFENDELKNISPDLTWEKKRSIITDDDCHIYLNIESIFIDIPDPSNWYIGLYDTTNEIYLTEKLILNFKEPLINKEKVPVNISSLFSITRSCILHNLIIFIKIYRFSGLSQDKKSESQALYKRPYAYCLYSLSDIIKGNPLVEYKEKLYIQFAEDFELGNAEKTFGRDLTKDRLMGVYYYMNVSLKYFDINLQKIQLENSDTFKSDLFMIPYISLPDIISPDYITNNFYLTIQNANFDKLSKGKPMNIEAAVTIWSANGQLLTNSIKIGHGKDINLCSEYKTAVIYHTNQPVWNETISLKLTTNKMENTRILITFHHISSSSGKSKVEKLTLLGYTVIKLENRDHSIIGNLELNYFIKKIDAGSNKAQALSVTDDLRKLATIFKESFSSIECSPDEINKYSLTDVLKIKTTLCSTIYSSIGDVYVLKDTNSNKQTNEFREVLSRFQYIDSIEIVKFLSDIFKNIVTSMLPIDEAGNNLVYFQALTKILSIVCEKRFSKFIVTLESAIEKTYFPNTWKYIIEYICYSIEKVPLVNSRGPYDVIKLFIDNLNFVFKVLQKSFNDYKQSNPESDEKISISLMDCFNKLFIMFNLDKAPHIYPLQLKLLNNFVGAIEENPSILGIDAISTIIDDLMNQIPNYSPTQSLSSNKQSSLIPFKVKFLKKLTNIFIFQDKDFRMHVIPIILTSLATFIKLDHDNMETCIDIASVLIQPLRFNDNDQYTKDLRSLTNTLLVIFFDVNVDFSSQIHYKDDSTVSMMLSLLSMVCDNMFKDIFMDSSFEYQMNYLTKMFRVFYNIFAYKLYPKSYVVVWVGICAELIKITSTVYECLINYFSQPLSQSITDLMHSFFDFSIEFINAHCFDTQNLTNISISEYLYTIPDMRIQMAQSMFRLWSGVEPENMSHLSNYAQSLVTTSLLDLPELREMTFSIIFDILLYDYKINKSMDNVRRIIISYIDSATYSPLRYQQFSKDFEQITTKLFLKCDDLDLRELGLQVTKQILEIIEILIYYSVPEKFEECTFLHAIRAYHMIDFHQRISHSELIQLNLLRLLKCNLSMDAYTEAALCYTYMADTLTWDLNIKLPEIDQFESSTPGRRKEQFLQNAIELFERGMNLEMAINSCQTLKEFYQYNLFDFVKLSELHKHISTLVLRIARGESSIDNYYRFTFVGLDFPQPIQNKSFICHMGSCATLGNTINFLKKQFPTANIPLTSTWDETLSKKYVQYIFVQALLPLPSDKELYDKVYKSSETVSRFYKNANITSFSGTMTIENKKERNEAGQPICTFIKSICNVEYKLPSINIVSTIISETKTQISEFDQNIDILSSHNMELQDLCRNLLLNPTLIKNIQMKTSGCLNAFVNGGLSMIIPKYFSDTYLLENPCDAPKIDHLRRQLVDFMNTNADALQILYTHLADSMAGFMINLIESYQSTAETLEKKAGISCFDLSYLLSFDNSSSQQIYSTTDTSKKQSINSQQVTTPDPNFGSSSGISSRKDTGSSNDIVKNKDIYGTVKSIKSPKKIVRLTPTESTRARSDSNRSNEKLQSAEFKEPQMNPTQTITEKIKKKSGLFHKKK